YGFCGTSAYAYRSFRGVGGYPKVKINTIFPVGIKPCYLPFYEHEQVITVIISCLSEGSLGVIKGIGKCRITEFQFVEIVLSQGIIGKITAPCFWIIGKMKIDGFGSVVSVVIIRASREEKKT